MSQAVEPRKRLPRRWFPWAFGLLMGLVMTGIVTLAISLVFDAGGEGAVLRWLSRWLLAWWVATPVIALLSPPMRRWLARHIEPPGV
ncbi:DUF2798 domain-containing protein [Luteimonas sp. e5]